MNDIIRKLKKALPQDCFLYEDTIVIHNKKQMREIAKILDKYTPCYVGVGPRRITYKGPHFRLFAFPYDAGLEQMLTSFLTKYSQKIHPKF